MEKLKDFLYNKNDLIIALLILAAAAAVIYFRLRAIMSYGSADLPVKEIVSAVVGGGLFIG